MEITRLLNCFLAVEKQPAINYDNHNLFISVRVRKGE